ncbi:MAG: hypothetical protein KDB16_16250, partial [Acidimicrobiales bacterium]|nr:hypothetical protein [Acidimicrobiales bacterium]
MRFASSLSTHPHAPTAAGEIVGELLDTLGDSPDAAVVLVAGAHAGLLAPICSAVRDLAGVGVTVGASASAVIGNGRVVENTPAISVWAAITSAATPFHLSLEPTGAPGGERAMRGVESVQLEHADAAFVLAAPDFALEAVVGALHGRHSHLRIAGGTISAGAAQTTQMWVDGQLHHDGAVGLLLGAQDDHVPAAATAHGASPVGQAMVVTAAVGRSVQALAGAKATDALDRLVLGPTELLGPQW